MDELHKFILSKLKDRNLDLPKNKTLTDVVKLIAEGGQGWSSSVLKKLLSQIEEIVSSEKKYSPYRIKFLDWYSVYFCTICERVLPINENKCNDRSACKKCKSHITNEANKANPHRKEYQKQYREANWDALYKKHRAYYITKSLDRRKYIKVATPLWANKAAILEKYKACPEGYQVDHIIPLRGETVCGLHVEYNLQYLTKEENAKKHNKLLPEYQTFIFSEEKQDANITY